MLLLQLPMNRSASQRQMGRDVSKSPSRRAIYLNEETSKKEVNTTFHSPYKDGKPNPQYFNPSFLSSHLFYPQEYLDPQQQQVVVTKNYLPNANDLQKETLYRQRLRTQHTQQTSHSKTKEKDSRKTREFNQQRQLNITPILRVNQPETLLKNELGTLHNYRQQYTQKQQRYQDLSRKKAEPQIPPYLQKPRRRDHTPGKDHPKTVEWEEHAAVVKELSELRRELNRMDIQEGKHTDKIIVRNRELQREEESQQRKQGQLLGNILREQIRTNEMRRDRKWNF